MKYYIKLWPYIDVIASTSIFISILSILHKDQLPAAFGLAFCYHAVMWKMRSALSIIPINPFEFTRKVNDQFIRANSLLGAVILSGYYVKSHPTLLIVSAAAYAAFAMYWVYMEEECKNGR
ncbi:hypothetical protein [Gemmobacter denitrificans]|uniref:Uncharacterized protein n=1 Tax=Gemmobacter denitrificans TaxID=3123040 RepID=A0ABU8C1Z8_9RHOB